MCGHLFFFFLSFFVLSFCILFLGGGGGVTCNCVANFWPSLKLLPEIPGLKTSLGEGGYSCQNFLCRQLFKMAPAVPIWK